MPNVEKNGVWPNTDLDLNTSGSLPEAPITVGMSPDSLSAATKAALTHGFQTDNDGSFVLDDESNCAADVNSEVARSVPVGASVTALVRPEAYRNRKY